MLRCAWLLMAGLFLTVASFHARRADPLLLEPGFIGNMALMFAAGFAIRMIRRKVVFGRSFTMDQSIAFEALFQGAALVHPQLPFNVVESEFIRRETGLSHAQVASWLHARRTTAGSFLFVAAACVLLCARQVAFAGIGFAAAAVIIAFGMRRASWEGRPVVPVLGGVVTILCAFGLEGVFFVRAAGCVNPEAAVWQAALVYVVLLVLYESSPIPLAIGVLEAACVILAFLPGLPRLSLAVPVGYRLFRGLPMLAALVFYLARYKLTMGDLFDPGLAPALRTRRRAGTEPAPSESSPMLSVVIPAYNEEDRLPRYLPDVLGYCSAVEGGAEVIVVDDGSTDGTADYVGSLAEEHPGLRLVRQEVNRGKGAAVRRGVLETRGRFVLFADADGATPIGEASKLLDAAKAGAEVVIGSRPSELQVGRSALRGLMAAVFYRAANLLALPAIADPQCGFKLFRRDAAARLFPLVAEDGWAFDVEVLFLAQKYGDKIAEVPVRWHAVAGSKIRPLRDAVSMLLAIMRIRRRDAGLSRLPFEQ